jgi:6-phosphogluconolactonase
MTRPTATRSVHVLDHPHAVVRAAAEEILRTGLEVLQQRKAYTLALPSGPLSRSTCALLAGEGEPTFRQQMPWPDTHLFWTDERPVPADHPQSHYRMVREALLARLTLTKKQVHRIRTEGMNPVQAAAEHARELKQFFGDLLMLRYDLPRFDLILLELGADGRVAGLLPGSPHLNERKALVVAPKVANPDDQRVTLTLPVVNMAAHVVVMATGKDKAEAVKSALEGAGVPSPPGRLIAPTEGKLTWLLDRDAGALLERP